MFIFRKRLDYLLFSALIFVILFGSLFWLLQQETSAEPLLEGGNPPPTFDLEITKAVTPTSGLPGTTVTYTLTISNNGPQVANDLLISDTLPAEIVVTHIDTGGDFVTQTITPTLSWSYFTLNSGEQDQLTITGIISPGLVDGVILTNTAVISQSVNRPLPVLMGGGLCVAPTIDIGGSNATLLGNIHSNGDVNVSGGGIGHTITGFVTYGTGTNLPHVNTTLFPTINNPSQVPFRNYPISYDYDDFIPPNGYIYQAIVAANPSHYHFYDGEITTAVMQTQGWMVGSVIEEGIYVAPGGFDFTGASGLIGDDVTFISQHGEIDFSGSAMFRPYFGGLLMMTEATGDPCDNNSAIQLSSSNLDWGGIIYAPNGKVSMGVSGGGAFYGSIIAGTIDVFGADLFMTADQQYKSVESDFSNNTAEAVFTLIPPYPTADPGGPYNVDEGSTVQLDASASSGINLSDYDWDLDNDGMYDDASGVVVNFGNTADNAVYAIGLRVGNSYGFTDTAVTTVTVNNVAPLLNDLSISPVITESKSVTLTGTILDPGVQDTFTMTVNWTDGNQDTFFYPANTTVFTLSHQYLDDPPGPSESYSITLNITDKDGGSDSVVMPIQVLNSPPSVDAGPDQETVVNTAVQVSGTFTDLGPLDTHIISWDFGDGTIVTGSLTATHTFVDAGTYTITLTVLDDYGGQGSDTLVMVVASHTIYLPAILHQSAAANANNTNPGTPQALPKQNEPVWSENMSTASAMIKPGPPFPA